MAPLQLAVYWRLSLLFFFTSFQFFLDIYTVRGGSCVYGGDSTTTSATPTHFRTLLQNQTVEQSGNDSRTSRGAHSDCVWLSYGQTLYVTGLLLGSLFGGAVSDWYGRRLVLMVCVCVHAVCSLVPAALPQPILFLALRCLTGVCCCCINICSFSLAVEWSLPRHRVWPPALLVFSFSVGMMVQAPLAYACPTWTQLHLVLGLPQILCLPFYISLPESPPWLVLKRKTDVLDQYRTQDKNYLDQLLDSTGNEMKEATEVEADAAPDHTPCDITHLRHPTVVLRLVVMSFLGLTTAFTYYGICLNIGSFGVDVYHAQFFSGLSEAPSIFIPFLLARLGRRSMSMLTLFLSGVACLVSLLVSQSYDEPVLEMSLALVGKFCMLTHMFVSLLYGIELFPTVVRQKCLALVNLFFRVGCVINSLVSFTAGIPLAAMIVYSGGPIIGSLLCLLLPETSRLPLPDSLEDCDRQPQLRLAKPLSVWWRGHHEGSPGGPII